MPTLLMLTLENGETYGIDEYEENAIADKDDLTSLFNGTAAIYYVPPNTKSDNSKGFIGPEDMLFNLEPGEDPNEGTDPNEEFSQPFTRIKSVEWDFAGGYENPAGYRGEGFKAYVQNKMNENSKDNVGWCYDVIHHGCASGCVDGLVYTSDCLKVLAEHAYELQSMIQEIASDYGTDESMKLEEFSFDKLIWMCFEEVVRDALRKLELNDA